MRNIEVVTIEVNGQRWRAFKSISINAAFNDAVRTASFKVAAEAGASATNRIFSKGAEVKIYLNSDLVLTGNVNRRRPLLKGKDSEIGVEVRSASADLVDGSAEHKTGHFKKKDPKEIADEISKNYTKTGFTTDKQLKKKDYYNITPGETVFRCIEKLCREQGMTMTGTADGKILITDAKSAKKHAGMILEGRDFTEGGSDHDETNQHSEVRVLGQRPRGHGDKVLEIEGVAKNTSVKRHRPQIVVNDGDTTEDLAKDRAKTRKERENGDALKANITVQGFRDEAGKVWEPGYTIFIESPFLDVSQDMLIESVEFSQDDGGSLSYLSLTDPGSYGGSSGKANKSGSDWSQGDE